MKRIYLDNAATTKPDSRVVLTINKINEQHWGNASSIHGEGQQAKKILEDSRRQIAEIVGCNSEEIIFTSGGTEADNLAIKGVIDAFYSKSEIRNPKSLPSRQAGEINPNFQNPNKLKRYKLIPHVITSAFEHHAVLDTIRELERVGLIEATYIKPNSEGLIRVEDIGEAIRDNTILVSIMYVNNEVGTVQAIKQIGDLLRIKNSELRKKNINRDSLSKIHSFGNKFAKQIYFHTDAVQAVEYFDINPDHLGVDLMSLAAHKFHGPKGVGVLYVRKRTPLIHQQIGGGQERKLRAGTENVAGIKGMAEAIKIASNYKLQITNVKSIKRLRDKLIDGILKNIPDTILNGSREFRSPANANITFKNAEGESIIMMLDMAGVAVSSGSACTSGSLDPSHVLLLMGIPAEEAHGSIRFTLGRDTTEGEIDKVLEILPPIIERLRKMSPLGK